VVPNPSPQHGVHFTPGETGSSLFRSALAEACTQYPDTLGEMVLPEGGKKFKAQLPELIVQFEAHRADSEQRVDIARSLVDSLKRHTRFGPEGALLSESLDPGPSESNEWVGTGPVGWTPEVDYRGRRYAGKAIGELAERMRADHLLTQAATDALLWVTRELLDEPLDLRGHSFALLGAGAELAPTPYLLRAGARVLWVDLLTPDAWADRTEEHAGTLVHHPAATDLLADPGAVYRALTTEAAKGPMHLGLYAYAPGKGRELLLAASMNTLAERLDDDVLRSVAMLISPTTPGEVQPEGRVDRQVRHAAAPLWQRALTRIGRLSERSHHRQGDTEIARSIVPLQGPTYLAAQYLTKMMTAETWAIDRAPLRISPNVAGITRTKSLEHPLFLAGFIGAPAFGIQVFTSDQTRVLTTLLMLHDALNPNAPSADPAGGPAAQARRLAARSIHGGVRSAPFVFWNIIQVAAVLGLGKKPSLLLPRRG